MINKQNLKGKKLTLREAEIYAKLASTGATLDVIAKELGISRRTLESHKDSICTKLSLKNRYEIMVHYYNPKENILQRGEDIENTTNFNPNESVDFTTKDISSLLFWIGCIGFILGSITTYIMLNLN